jgi:hypothetical protein
MKMPRDRDGDVERRSPRETPPRPTGGRVINEGTIKKGGTNDPPTTPPPRDRPIGQGGRN